MTWLMPARSARDIDTDITATGQLDEDQVKASPARRPAPARSPRAAHVLREQGLDHVDRTPAASGASRPPARRGDKRLLRNDERTSVGRPDDREIVDEEKLTSDDLPTACCGCWLDQHEPWPQDPTSRWPNARPSCNGLTRPLIDD